MNSSILLSQFYCAMAIWLRDLDPLNIWGFTKHTGLCSNLDNFARYHKLNDTQHLTIYEEMRIQFIQAGLSEAHPFNVNLGEYLGEIHRYKNPQRLQWIKEHSHEQT